jgi:hypothetical protein
VVIAGDPYGRNLGFLDRTRYFFFQIAPQMFRMDFLSPSSGSSCCEGSRLIFMYTLLTFISFICVLINDAFIS